MAAMADNDKLILEQAVRWHLWLRDNKADAAEVEVFQRWCSSNPKHRQAYERVERLSRNFDGIDALDLPWPSALELSLDQYDGSYALPLPEGRNPLRDQVADFQAASGDFVLKVPQPKPKRRAFALHLPALAASVAALALMLGLIVPRAVEWLGPPVNSVYVTGIGQQRVEQLEDGSTVTLGGNSRLTVAFSPSQRRLLLESGEVFFKVAKDASRPFVVTVGSSEVTAVGTAFNINRREQAVTVSVVEGIVEVRRASDPLPVETATGLPADDAGKLSRLVKGQELEFDRSGKLWRAHDNINLERATTWQQGRLAFVNERLDRVIEDVNRYSSRKLILGDRVLAELRYTGTVFNADIDAWLQGLEQAFAVRVLNIDDRIVLVKDVQKKSS